MTYSSEVLADAPAAFYRHGEASGTAMVDSSGNARDGVYTAVTLGTAGLLTGDANTAGTYNGTSSQGIVGTYAAWMDPANFTLEAWIKTSSTGSRAIIDRDNASSGTTLRSWQFRLNGGNLEFIKIRGGTQVITATATLNDGARHHVAATYDGTNLRLYIDGTVVNTTAMTSPVGSTAYFSVGANHSGSGGAASAWFNGVIDEVAYYPTALSSTRINTHYTVGTAAPSATVNITADATLPAIISDLTLASYTDTATRNLGANGRPRRGGFIDESPDPVAVLPANLARRVDKAIAYPTPTLVDGRPT